MKKLFKTLASLILILAIITVSYGATFIDNSNAGISITKTPTSFSYKDIIRLEEVATVANEKQVKVVNAVKYNGNDAIWIARLKFGIDENAEYADFILKTLPYTRELGTNKITSLPFTTLQDGIDLYGAKWYYYGILDDKTHNICGYIVAQRIKRWSKVYDLEYTGKAKDGTIYTGAYTEECNDEFLKLHTEILGD